MACNTTIIATNVGGNKEISLDHNTRILIKHHSKIFFMGSEYHWI